ncbi:MAG: hypothetical protein NUV81_00325 [bacterium]|nr:hypothetical protein [bacterium]
MDHAIAKLLRWYRTHKRKLPWRDVMDANRNPDAYKIFVSEIMLQQTQVDRVIPKFRTWLKIFPTWKKLSDASNANVIRAWSGLGYNRRAIMIRDSARRVTEEGVPQDEISWRALPGVGPYTSAVLAGFVNHKRTIAIDTNVRRVAGRAFCGIAFPQQTDHERVHRALKKYIPKKGKTWEIAPAFMDLGSLICTTKNPNCSQCPLKSTCRAQKKGVSFNDHTPQKKGMEKHHLNKPFPDRIYRGRILACISNDAILISTLGKKIDETFSEQEDSAWLERMLTRLEKDLLIQKTKKKIFLSTRA